MGVLEGFGGKSRKMEGYVLVRDHSHPIVSLPRSPLGYDLTQVIFWLRWRLMNFNLYLDHQRPRNWTERPRN